MLRTLALITLLFGVTMTTDSLAQQGNTPMPTGTQPTAAASDTFVITVHRGNTDLGTIELVLWPDVAPLHSAFFAQRVAEGWYNGSAFHRVIPGFMIQGGDPNSKSGPSYTWGTGGWPEKVKAEFSNRLHERGVLSAARTNDPNSFGGQFFICVARAASLDGQYSAFGQVVKGMEVADAIVSSPRDGRDNPLEKIEMTIVKKGS
jgi:peptidyl-prolyl cis-trans isomerase B (cyclophilin B)